MSAFRDLLGVAWTGLTARKVRTLLIMLGPIVGVAAMVGAVGLTESAKGDLKAKLAVLGTNLIIAQAGGTFGSQNPTFPDDAVKREIEKERNAIIAKSARLKALRLAKEEADREAARLNPPPEKKKRAPRKKA